MAQLVLAVTMSHVNPMGYGYDEAEVRQNQPVMQAIGQVGRRLAEVQPDVLLMVGSDHVRSFFLDNAPPFCLGTATAFNAWEERGLPRYTVAGSQPMARFILEQALFEAGQQSSR